MSDTPNQPPTLHNIHTHTVGCSPDPKNQQKFLMRDGRIIQCHKQPPIITPKQIQGAGPQFDINHIHCSLDCGKANIVEINGIPHWQQTCDPLGLSLRLQSADEKAK